MNGLIKKGLMLLTCCFLFLLSTSEKQEEGMFPLSELSKLDLKKAGLRMATNDLFNPEGTSLVNAIVRVGGCTGSFINEDGLIVTNHHCAFSSLASISDTVNNYLDKGFLAQTKPEEQSAKGLVCKITKSYEDVSDKILAGIDPQLSPSERLKLIGNKINEIVKIENGKYPDLSCEISEMFTGKSYVLFRYQLLKDVRMVYVPPRYIGEYGGENDNWVWPRHSGDFAILRAYVSPEGKATEYNSANVPFKPSRYLKINPKGVSENDFVFILGYPGRTFRHQSADFYQYHQDKLLPYTADLYEWQIQKMEELSHSKKSNEIKFASRIKSLANTSKNYRGKLQGFHRLELVKKKREEESAMQSFINSNPERKTKYGTLLEQIKNIYKQKDKLAEAWLWLNAVNNNPSTIKVAAIIANYRAEYNLLKGSEKKLKFKEELTKKLKGELAEAYGPYDRDYDHAFVRKMFRDVLLISDLQFFTSNNDFELDDTQLLLDKYLYKYTHGSKIEDFKKTLDLAGKDPIKLIKRSDPMVKFAEKIVKEYRKYAEQNAQFEAQLAKLMTDYIEVKSDFKQASFIPDANSTLRFTYGFVKGYRPADGLYCQPFTTLKGILEKVDGITYTIPPIMRQLILSRDFGKCLDSDLDDVPVDFLYNLDTTGGNSGSPVMNADGELIGINFDRAYTATINDYAWSETYSRSVGCDIRYMLFVLKKVAMANNLLAELHVKI